MIKLAARRTSTSGPGAHLPATEEAHSVSAAQGYAAAREVGDGWTARCPPHDLAVVFNNDGINMNKTEFRVASPADLQAMYDDALRAQRARYGAAPTTVEALIFSLGERGSAALAEQNCQRRLAELSPAQVREVIERLGRLQSKFSLITDSLLLNLAELIA